LNNNNFKGILPTILGRLAQLVVLALEHNHFIGTLPSAVIGKLQRLRALSAEDNGFSGSLPNDFLRLTRLQKLTLGSNRFTGPMLNISQMLALQVLALQNNSLGGSVPDCFAEHTLLKYLLLSSNQLTGTLPQLPLGIEMALLHKNDFFGPLRPFTGLRNLTNLTLFGNRFEGRLALPLGCKMKILFAHSNRLSCLIEANGTEVTNSSADSSLPLHKSLLLPGNAFQGPPPASLHLAMHNATFLYVTSFWDTWKHEIWVDCFGLCALCAMVAASPHLLSEQEVSLKERVQASARTLIDFASPSPNTVLDTRCRRVLGLQLWCSKALAGWALLALVTLLPLYESGANYFECGQLWLHGTLAYLSDDPTIEWCCAAMACLYAGMGAALISALQRREHLQEASSSSTSSSALQVPQVNWKRHSALVVLWLLVVAALSFPMVLAMLSLSLPPGDENVLGLGQHILTAARLTMGAVLYLIKSYVLPKAADWLVRLVYRGQARPPVNTAGAMAMFGMLWIAVLTPAITVLAVNQDCFASWLQMWEPCAGHPDSFSTYLDGIVSTIEWAGGQCATGLNRCKFDASSNQYVQINSVPISLQANITSHAEICSVAYVADGRCPRALVGALGDLYAKDLAFSFVLGSLLSLLRSTPQARAAKEWLVRTIFRRKNYKARTSIDRLVVSVVLMLELPLVMGFCYPVLPLLAFLSVRLNAGVFYTVLMHHKPTLDDTVPVRVSPRYLWGSLCIGCALVIWLFVECDFHGRWLVSAGVPTAVGTVLLGCQVAHRMSNEPQEQGIWTELASPLLDGCEEMPGAPSSAEGAA